MRKINFRSLFDVLTYTYIRDDYNNYVPIQKRKLCCKLLICTKMQFYKALQVGRYLMLINFIVVVNIYVWMSLHQHNILFQLFKIRFHLRLSKYFRNGVGENRQTLILFLQFFPVLFQALKRNINVINESYPILIYQTASKLSLSSRVMYLHLGCSVPYLSFFNCNTFSLIFIKRVK